MVPRKEEVLPSWGMALAGSSGALVANTIVYPLDIIKTRIQVQSHIISEKGGDDHYENVFHAIGKIIEKEGAAGLYNGIGSNLVGVVSTNFAYFYWYAFVRSLYLNSPSVPKPPGTAAELSLGAAAGALAQLFTIPVSTVCTRQQMQTSKERKSMLGTAEEIINSSDGWTGLWRGMKASLILVVNPSITYGAYERLRNFLFAGRKNLAPWEAFILGSLSKALATIVTQPLIVAKVRLQSKPPAERNGKPFASFQEVLAYTIEHEGWLALFKGIVPQLMKGILVQGILMMTKEKVEVLFVLLFAYLKNLRRQQLAKLAQATSQTAKSVAPALVK